MNPQPTTPDLFNAPSQRVQDTVEPLVVHPSPDGNDKPYLVPMTLRKANDFVAAHHRHNGRTARNGGKWSCGLACKGQLVGVAIVGNPLSATLMDGWTAEVLRVCTVPEAPKGACSMLYQACWRAWRAMGGQRLITYTLQTESGASLRGAGWRVVGQTKPVKDGWRKDDHLNERRTHSPVMLEVKNRWQQDDMHNNRVERLPTREAVSGANGGSVQTVVQPICDMLLDQDCYVGSDPVGHHCWNQAAHVIGGTHFICDDCAKLLRANSTRVTIPTVGSVIGWNDRVRTVIDSMSKEVDRDE